MVDHLLYYNYIGIKRCTISMLIELRATTHTGVRGRKRVAAMPPKIFFQFEQNFFGQN
jgi:hypothetical protein